MKYKFLLTLLLFSILLNAQTYKGKLTDPQNEPIAFADIVALKQSDNSIITGVNSDDNGNFELPVTSEETFYLEIRFIGFETLKINPTKTDLGTITLKESTQKLEEVVIKSRKKLIERKVDRLVFNVGNSPQATIGDATEVLKVTPSIRVRNDRITMIGKSGVQVMVNDKLIRLSGDALVNYLSSIPSDNIKNIEVISAPPAKYDANGNNIFKFL